MKSVLVSAEVFERQRVGGISHYFIELARFLNDNQLCRVRFESVVHINRALKAYRGTKSIYLPFSPTRFRLESMIGKVNDTYGKRISSAQRIDIKHISFISSAYRAPESIPYVITIYDLIREKFSPNDHMIATRQKMIDNAAAIIAISDTTAADLKDFYSINEACIHRVYLGVDHKIFYPNFSPFKTSPPYQLLYVGERNGYKSFRTLIEAFRLSDDLRKNFKVLAFGKKFEPEEVRLLQDYHLQSIFSQQNGNDQLLAQYYRSSLALVITSKYEGFGLPVIEAMASGCIVLSTRGGSLGEISGGLDLPFEYGNPESLEYAIHQALNLSFSRSDYPLVLSSYAESFDWGKAAYETLDIYNSISHGV